VDDAPIAGPVTDLHVDRLREYYEDSWFDYRFLWLDPRTRAMHFGYDHRNWRRHDDSLLSLNERMADRIGLRRGERVLDAGCGVGGTSFWLTEQFDCDAVGVNVVADHVLRARRYTAERGLTDRPRFEVGDYCRTGLDDETFDVVWATESACHAPDKSPFLDEAFRLLRPGGRLVLAEYLTKPDADGNRHDSIDVWEDAWEMTLVSEQQWRDALGAAGFVGVEVTDVTQHMRGSLRRLRRLCSGLGPIAACLRAVGVRTAAQQRNITGSNAMWTGVQADAWFYAIMSATKPTGDAHEVHR
jgi:cyclopropane fatty-acyl-phospholipid synthase-like methyltransferase